MNQILFEKEQEQKTDIKKIKIFFGITLIIFGIVLTGIGTWGFVTKEDMPEIAIGTKPNVETSVYEESQVLIDISHDKAIDKIIYSWNNGIDNIIQGRERTTFSELIEMPIGENVLNLRVIDILGEETVLVQNYVLSERIDIQKPTIELSIVESNATIVIKAKDETAISYITYRWNNEEETTKYATNEGDKEIEVTIPIQRGENSLTIIAVDTNNNTENRTESFTAVTKPTITVTQYADTLTITVRDEQELDRVEYNLNGQNYRWISQTEGRKEWIHEVKIPEGDSTIIINAWNKTQVQSDEYRGRCNYTP